MLKVAGALTLLRKLDKPLTKIAIALCAALMIPLTAVYFIGELHKENELQKELDALSYQSISPHKELMEELFRSIDRNTLLFSNTAAVGRFALASGPEEIRQRIRDARREIAELYSANCCDSSVEIYYRQTGLSISALTGRDTPVQLSDEGWEAYRRMLADKVYWFVDERQSMPDGSPTISFIRPIPAVGSQPQGLVKINFNTSLFQFGYRLPPGQSIWAAAPDGRFMFDMASGESTADTQLVRTLKGQPQASMLEKKSGGTYGYRLFISPTTGWSYLLILPPAAFSTANPVKWVIHAASLLFAVAVGLYVLRRFSSVARRAEVLAHKEEEIQGKLKELLPTLRQHGLRQLLFGEPPAEEACRKMLREYGLRESERGYVVALLRIEQYEKFLQYTYRDRSLYRFFMMKAAEEIGESYRYFVYAYDSGERDIALLYVPDEAAADAQTPFLPQVEQLIAVLRQYLPFRISAAIGSLSETAGRIHLSCQQALQTLDDQLFKGNSGVFSYEGASADSMQSAELYRLRRSTEQTVGKAVLSRDKELLSRSLAELRRELEAMSAVSLPIMRHTFWEMVMYLLHRVQEAGLKLSEQLRLSELHAQLEQLESLASIVDWCHGLSARLIDELQAGVGAGRVDIVSNMMDYVHANFDKEISLSGMADQMGLDTAYVSRCFKQEVGMTFIDYLLTLRIKHAKYLLSKPELTVGEVGEAVGYVNVNSFIRIFKKHEGITPGQYRDLNYPKKLDITRVY